MAYLRWQSKVDSLLTRARDIVPVHKRTSPLQDPCPVVALTNYKSPEVSSSVFSSRPYVCCKQITK